VICDIVQFFKIYFQNIAQFVEIFLQVKLPDNFFDVHRNLLALVPVLELRLVDRKSVVRRQVQLLVAGFVGNKVEHRIAEVRRQLHDRNPMCVEK